MSNTEAMIGSFLAADVPVLLWGPPGTGKTARILAMAAAVGAHVEVLIGSTIDPTDVGGWLLPSGDTVKQAPPPWALRLADSVREGREAWLFLDELSCAPPSVQAALLRLVAERKAGVCDLKGVKVVAAANPTDTAADGGLLSPATANRWAHLEVVLDPAAWVQGELGGWGNPRPAEAASKAAPFLAYIERNPQALLALPKTDAERGGAWPSPRSWSAGLRALVHAPVSERTAVLGACVGLNTAREAMAWIVEQDLPDPRGILNGTAAWPTRGDRIRATSLAVAAIALSEGGETVTRAWEVLTAYAVRPDVVLAACEALSQADLDLVPPSAYELGNRVRMARAEAGR